APGYTTAEEGMWDIHRNLDLADLHQNPELTQMLDVDLCLHRAQTLLLQPSRPAAAQIDDARKLLNLGEQQRPQRRHEVNYWRAVACAHAGELDAAASLLRNLLDEKQHPPAEAVDREPALVSGWHLALRGHPELKRKVGEPMLAEGRRLDAIAAV